MSGMMFDASVAQALDQSLQQNVATDSADRGTTPQALLPLDKGGGFSYFTVNLAQLGQGILNVGLKGYGLIYLGGLSTSGSSAILLVNGTFPMYPGCQLNCYFENLGLSLMPGAAATTGTAAFLVRTRPDASYAEPGYGTLNAVSGSPLGTQLLSTTLTASDLTGGNPIYIGSDGSRAFGQSFLQNVPAFDLRGYCRIEAFVNFSGLTGGTTPTLALEMDFFSVTENGNPSYSVNLAVNTTPGQTAGPLSVYAGVTYPTSSGPTNSSSPYLPPYARARLTTSGSPTGFAAGAPPLLTIMGYRA